MGGPAVMLSGGQVNSIVLDAAETSARRRGLLVSSAFSSRLLQRAEPYLTQLNEEGRLEGQRSEIEAATDQFIAAIAAQEQLRPGDELTAMHLSSALSWFCEKFPFFVPFCT